MAMTVRRVKKNAKLEYPIRSFLRVRGSVACQMMVAAIEVHGSAVLLFGALVVSPLADRDFC
jgi:hypothetical protein